MNNSSRRDLAHLLLKTDAAFGAAEVPLQISNLKSQISTQTARAQSLTSKSSVSKTDDSELFADAAAPEPGRTLIIHDLEPITDEEKRRRLAELSEQAAEELGKHLNDVATKVVFGEGDPAAKLMFIGEGPGAQEDQLGRPFVGRAGQLLDKMILAMGLQRQQVYIANVVKLRAAEPDPQTGRLKDRPPTTEEAALGLPWLVKQIEIIRPHVIVTLGASAARHLLGETSNMTSLRGNWRTFRGIQVMPTYHPSFLLRAYTPENRGRVWSDLKAVMNRLGLKVKSSSGPA